MREITSHKVNGCNEAIKITARDEPGVGGANHTYYLEYDVPTGREVIRLHFQEGPIGEVGVNGITNEALIAIHMDRLEGFQSGPFRCYENQDALQSLRRVLDALQDRTRSRQRRGVEGTHEI